MQEKKEAQAKAARRDIATLLERGKVETARIKVENVINEDIHLELLELLELYSELLIARFGLLETNLTAREPDPGVSEGVNAIVFAAPRTELKELHVLRDMLMHRFGREYSTAIMENKDGRVSERVTRKTATETPSPQLVDGYLLEIARGYGVDWEPPTPAVASQSSEDVIDVDAEEVEEKADLASNDEPPLKSVPGIEVKTQDAGKDTVDRLPAVPPTEAEAKKLDAGAKPEEVKPKSPAEDFDDLRKRFEALKKR